MKNLFFCLFSILTLSISVQAQSWSRLYIGFGAVVDAMCTDTAGNLYIGGYFSNPDGSMNVLKRSGATWVALGAGFPNTKTFAQIFSMCTDVANNIYAAGDFLNDSGFTYVAKWDGTSWSELGAGSANFQGEIPAICTDPFGNIFAVAGVAGDTTGNVYKWNGTTWSRLGSGTTALNANGWINSICSDPSGNIYAAGLFTNANPWNAGVQYVAKWNGSTWTALGSILCSLNPIGITSVITDNAGNVYSTGIFDFGTVSKWNGISWDTLGLGSNALNPNGKTLSLCKDPLGNIYAAGEFTDSAYSPGNYDNCYVAKWNGTTWSELGSGSNKLHPHDRIWTICSDIHGSIYAAGAMTNNSGIGFVGKFGYNGVGVSPLNLINEITVFPNPAHTAINIKIDASGTNLIGSDYYLCDWRGRIFKHGKLENSDTTITVDNIPSGIYMLKVHANNNVLTYKMIKE